ncbi:hypothetical protein TSOC_008977 [Tetrabaena socialis]|uniref:Uncharacterized protein n=1 Tax=Tetrabaena socialis TaxID=47790 RepID=A0A2J7ZWZ7_9CHLO|nr:hypothetical protein TSOC_008977 [Tetrabaena socialis]|eukprot:PNH04794.1 hypothetical protein TSOC_008977 [Tetrabaena socialis]
MPPATASGPPAASPSRPEPLSFSRWFARRAYAADLPLLLLELLMVSAFYRSEQLFSRMCLPVGGGPHAALQGLPLEPAAHRADALLAAFPCGASQARRLLYVLRTGAAVDPRVPLRLTDWGNAGYTFVRLLALGVPLAAPWLYERTRHGLYIAVTAASFLGAIASALWTPDALLPLVASTFTLQRPSALYLSWKAITVFRLFAGPAMWLLLLVCSAAMDRRTQLPGAPVPHRLSAIKAGLLFVVMAVLPYIVARIWEHLSLRPQYRAYLRRCGRAAGGGTHGDSTGPVALVPAPAAIRNAFLLNPSHVYGSGRGSKRRGTMILSVKVALPQVEDSAARHRQFQKAAAAVLAAAGSTLLPCLGQATAGGAPAAAAAGGGRGALAAAAAGEPSGAASAARSPSQRRRLHPISAVCVEGCVHLLLTLRWVEGGGEDGGEEEDGRSGSGNASVHHTILQQAAAGDIDAAEQEDRGAGGVGGSTEAPPPQLSKGADEVLVLLPAALLRGQGAVRCVVAGPTGRQQGQEVHLVVTVDTAAGNLRPAEPRLGSGSGDDSFHVLRLELPPAALRVAGALLLHLLPASTPPPPPQVPARGGAAVSVVGRDEAAAAANDSSAVSPRAMAGQPVASLPLLVLAPAAAAEVRQLYGDPLGGGLHDALDGLLRAAAAAAAGGGACVRLLAGGGEGAAAAASAAAAIAASGLTGIVYDMGDLLQLPYDIARVTPPPPDDLLSFLASRGMAACLRAGLHALRSAGVQLAEEDEAALLAEAAAGGGQPTTEGDASLGGLEAAGTNGAAGSAPCMEAKRGEAQRASAVRPAVCESPAGAQEEEADADAQAVGSGGRRMMQQQQPPLLPSQPVGALWWLRVLLRGFLPPALERSYQAFKAAQCRSLDRLALVLLVVLRLSALVPNLRVVLPGTAAGPAPHGLGAGWLAMQQQQLTSKAVFVGFGLAVVALAFGARLLQRRRNALCLLKAWLDGAALLLLLWPEAWCWRGHPMFAVPDVWVTARHRTSLYFLYSLWEPATLQPAPFLDEDDFETLKRLYKSKQRGSDCLLGPAGACKFFHQECCGRKQRLGHASNWWQYKKCATTGLKRKIVKDIRHFACNLCLESVQGSKEVLYTGSSGEV